MSAARLSPAAPLTATAVSPYLSSRRKRLFDLVLAVPAAIIATPLIVVLAVASAVTFRSWPFFVQERAGEGGQVLAFIKVRSLPRSAPPYADKYVISALPSSRFGRFIRRTHLDELPQLYLVVLGSMSLVGPRPEMRELATRFDHDFVEARLQAPPGCTGLWQVSDASKQLIGEAPEYDLFYVANASARLDLWLVRMTLWHELGRRTGVTLDSVPPNLRRDPGAAADAAR